MSIRSSSSPSPRTAGGLALVTAGAAGASSTADDAKIVLDQLCEHAAARRTRRRTRSLVASSPGQQGLRDRAAICEELADGKFVVTLGTTT